MREAALLLLNKDKSVIIPLDGLLSSFTQFKMWREKWENHLSLRYGSYEALLAAVKQFLFIKSIQIPSLSAMYYTPLYENGYLVLAHEAVW
jgi:hypothetical protein